VSTELVTQLIILATALVGLYKAATFRPGSRGETNSSASRDDRSGNGITAMLTPLLGFVGYFGFLLAFPLFIWAFTWITGNIGSSSSSAPASQYELAYEAPENPTNIEIMLISASQIPNEYSRGQALEIVSDLALSEGDLRIATVAASAIPNEYSRGNQLQNIVDILKKMPDKSMQPTANTSAD